MQPVSYTHLVEMLGAELGLSRSHLYKKLMCITGKGPAEFIRIIRLKRSKQLIKESQKQMCIRDRSTSCGNKKVAYQNPRPMAFGDPFLLKASDGKYYMYGTGGVSNGFKVYLSLIHI